MKVPTDVAVATKRRRALFKKKEKKKKNAESCSQSPSFELMMKSGRDLANEKQGPGAVSLFHGVAARLESLLFLFDCWSALFHGIQERRLKSFRSVGRQGKFIHFR